MEISAGRAGEHVAALGAAPADEQLLLLELAEDLEQELRRDLLRRRQVLGLDRNASSRRPPAGRGRGRHSRPGQRHAWGHSVTRRAGLGLIRRSGESASSRSTSCTTSWGSGPRASAPTFSRGLRGRPHAWDRNEQIVEPPEIAQRALDERCRRRLVSSPRTVASRVQPDRHHVLVEVVPPRSDEAYVHRPLGAVPGRRSRRSRPIARR